MKVAIPIAILIIIGNASHKVIYTPPTPFNAVPKVLSICDLNVSTTIHGKLGLYHYQMKEM